MTQRRSDITAKSQLGAFLVWLLGPLPQHSFGGTGRTFRHETAWCWDIGVPQPMVTGQIYDQIIVDGTYFQGWCVLIAHNGTHVIGWQWCDRENKAAWIALLRRFPPPRVVVTDGGTGLRSALDTLWPKVGLQRCFFHIRAQNRREVTLNPRLHAGKEIWALTLELMKVNDLDQAAAWLGTYASWEARWDEFFKERTYMRTGLDRPRNISPNARWWYTHRNLRSVRATYRRLIKDESLFTHLLPQFQGDTRINRTTSRLEGGVNAQIKNLLRTHRGMHENHAKRAIDWLLNSLTEHPHRTPS